MTIATATFVMLFCHLGADQSKLKIDENSAIILKMRADFATYVGQASIHCKSVMNWADIVEVFLCFRRSGSKRRRGGRG